MKLMTLIAAIVTSSIGLAAVAQVVAANKTTQASSTTPPATPQEDDYQPGTESSDVVKPRQKHYTTANENTTFGLTGVAAGNQGIGQVSVLCFKQPEPKEIGETMEDIATLSFLLSRNLQHAFAADTSDYKLGIPMLLTANQSITASYVQEFGAILKMQVRFPVAGLADEPEPTEPAKTGSEWDEAKRELLEGDNPPANSWNSSPEAAGREPYDSKLVHTLKKRILALLKNASNIRHMNGNEWIIVKVVGTPNPSGVGDLAAVAGAGGGIKAGKKVRNASGSNQATVMTLRVKKSEIDAFAAGSLSEEQFIKNAEVAAYFNPVQGDANEDASWGNVANSWLQRK
jgi:hypothetical protein